LIKKDTFSCCTPMHSCAQVGTSLVETRDSFQRAAVALKKVQILNNEGVFA